MKLKMSIIMLSCMSVFLLSVGCTNPPDGSIEVAAERVHIVGDYGSWNTAFYWNNGGLTILDAPDGDFNVSASSIAVSNGAAYVGGEYDGHPCYWVDGIRNDIICDSGNITGIAVDSGGRLILAGNCNEEASVWIDGVRSALQVPSGYMGVVNALSVIDDKIYVAGSSISTDDLSDQSPCYWSDGVFSVLPVPASVMPGGSARTSGIAVLGSSVIVSGTYDSDADNTGAGYWQTGEWNDLDGTTARGVSIGGNNVCFVGRDMDGACYWLNNEKTSLLAIHSTIASAAASSGNTFVAAGKRGAIGQSETLGYWSGGEFNEIHEHAIADINGIYITD